MPDDEDARTFVLRRRARFIVAAAAIGAATAPIVACGEEQVCLSLSGPKLDAGADTNDGDSDG